MKIIFNLFLILFTFTLNAQELQYYQALEGMLYHSNFGSSPQGAYRYNRTVYLITQSELTDSNLNAGDILKGIGWHLITSQEVSTTGSLKVYLENTNDFTYSKGNMWQDVISNMTLTSNQSSFTIPASHGVYYNHFSGGNTFTYTGGGIYVAFEYLNPTGPIANLFGTSNCTTTLTSSIFSNMSNAVPNNNLLFYTSSFRPETFFAKEVTCASPLALKVDSFSDTSVTIKWDVAANYEIEWGEFPYEQGSSLNPTTASIENATQFQISLLNSGTTYDVYVKKICNANSSSDWEHIIVGTKNNSLITLPYETSFDLNDNQQYLFNLGWVHYPFDNLWTIGYSSLLADTGSDSFYVRSFNSIINDINATLYAPPVFLEAGNPYTINYRYRVSSSSINANPMSFNVVINTSNDGTTTSSSLVSHTSVSNDNYSDGSTTFTPITSGTYYFGFHNNTQNDETKTILNYLLLDNVAISTSLSEDTFDYDSIALNPNPVNDILFIKSSNVIEIALYDISGRFLKNYHSENRPLDMLNLSFLEKGLYIVQLKTDNGLFTKKIIKN